MKPTKSIRRAGVIGIVAVLLLAATMSGADADAPVSPPPPKCQTGNCLDPLFTVQFPHRTTATTRAGVSFPLPLHYYDAGLFGVIGTADLATEQQLTAHTDYQPVVTSSGRGIGALLMADYVDDDLGPYHEAMVAFPVHRGERAVVSDDPGAMAAAVFDPSNQVWVVRLILDNQLPIDVGREYLGIPKVPTPESMPLTLTPSHVTFAFSEANGTPIASGDVAVNQVETPGSAFDFATQPATIAAAAQTARRSYLDLKFVYRDVRHPSALASGEVAARAGANARVAIAPFDGGSHITANPDAAFGSDLAALRLQPALSLVIENLHVVLDGHLGSRRSPPAPTDGQ